MNGDLLDVNVLLALAWPNHQFHEVARRWFRDLAGRRWFTCSITEVGFVRLSCNPAFSADFKTPREATALLSAMLKHPDHGFIEDSLSIADEGFSVVVENLQGFRQITDAHLVALAQAQGLTFLTFDRKIKAFCPFPDVIETLELVKASAEGPVTLTQ